MPTPTFSAIADSYIPKNREQARASLALAPAPTPAAKITRVKDEETVFSSKIPTEVEAITDLPTGAKVLFGYLCSLSKNVYKSAFCSNAHLAMVFGRTERTIQRWLRALVLHRLIKRKFRKIASNNSLRKIRIIFKPKYKSYVTVQWTAKEHRNFTVANTLAWLRTQTRRHFAVERIPYLHTPAQIARATGTPLSTIHAVLRAAKTDKTVLTKTRPVDKPRGWYTQQTFYTAKPA